MTINKILMLGILSSNKSYFLKNIFNYEVCLKYFLLCNNRKYIQYTILNDIFFVLFYFTLCNIYKICT